MLETRAITAFQDNYIWLIVNPISNTVAIVDPGDADVVIEALTNLKLDPVAILITHHHHDHVGGIPKLLQYYHVPVYGPASETIPGRTHAVTETDVVNLPELDARFDIIEVPGHTCGHIAYYGHKMLFIGDTLFMAGCGRLFEGTAAQMHASLDKVASLPDDTRVYCAHEYTLANLHFAHTVEPRNVEIETRIKNCTLLRNKDLPTVPGTLAIELLTNPFLRTNIPEVITAAENFSGVSLTNQTDVFSMIRKWKDQF